MKAKRTKLPRGHGSGHSKQQSLREVYLKSCSETGIHPNSGVIAMLPEKPGVPFFSDILDVSHNYLGDKGVLPIIAVAGKISDLRSLILRENGLRNKSVQSLCTMAMKHPTLEHIDLSDNCISTGAGISLESLLRGNRRIVDLIIDNTKIDVEHRVILRELLEVNQGDLVAAETGLVAKGNAPAAGPS